MQTDYKALFNKIDKDGSGSIDTDELFASASELFPQAKITKAMVRSMMKEADTDGNEGIDFDEFRAIMQAAGKHNVKSMGWNSFASNARGAILAVKEAIVPLRSFGEDHSYICDKTGNQVVEGGVRVLAELVVICFVASVAYLLHENSGSLLAWRFAWEVWILLAIWLNLICMVGEGQSLTMNIFGFCLVDSKGKRFSFWGIVAFLFVYALLSPVEFFMLLLTGYSLTEQIFGASMVAIGSIDDQENNKGEELSNDFCLFSFFSLFVFINVFMIFHQLGPKEYLSAFEGKFMSWVKMRVWERTQALGTPPKVVADILKGLGFAVKILNGSGILY